jgi:hypothetical protein
LISLFGRKEFDPPGMAMKDPRSALQVSGLSALTALGWLSISVERVSHFRSSDRPVSSWREAAVGFWVVMLLFWMWNWWKNFRKYRAERKVV